MTSSPLPLIDIGANLTNSRFHGDLPEVLARAQRAGVGRVIVTGTSERASRDALAMAKRYPAQLSCTAGVHPHDAKHWSANTAAVIAELAANREVLAIGECGLDFNRMFSPEAQQMVCYEAQLALAARLRKPVFLHQRDAHQPFFELLKRYRPQLSGAVVHCFTGNVAEVKEYLALNCHIGITGWVCDERRGDDLRQAVKHIPLDRLMIETDAPFLTPRNLTPKPAGNRNEPAYLPSVLETLARLLQVAPTVLAAQTVKNSQEFFALPNN